MNYEEKLQELTAGTNYIYRSDILENEDTDFEYDTEKNEIAYKEMIELVKENKDIIFVNIEVNVTGNYDFVYYGKENVKELYDRLKENEE
jgi:hypothetical protein